MTRNWSALARDYDRDVLSPFLLGGRFPLHRALRRLAAQWRRDGSLLRRIALDLGCGTGPALPALARSLGLVIGIDFTPAMLAASVRRLRESELEAAVVRGAVAAAREMERWSTAGRPRRVIVAQAHLSRLGPLDASADVVLAINSLVPPTARAAVPLFQALARVMKRGGTAIIVLPALDGLAYLTDLHAQRNSRVPVKFVHWDEGIVTDGAGIEQKYYLPHEIRELLSANGLRVTRLERIAYPWRLVSAYGWGDFPGKRRVWDWYVEARRT